MNSVSLRNAIRILFCLALLLRALGAKAADSGIVGAKVTHTTANPKSHWTPERIQRAIKNHRLPNLNSPPLLQPDAPFDADVRTSPPSGLGRGATPALPQLPGRIDTQFVCPITRLRRSSTRTIRPSRRNQSASSSLMTPPEIQWFAARRSSTGVFF